MSETIEQVAAEVLAEHPRHPVDPRPCQGGNSNVCVAEGCFNEACVKLATEGS